MFVPLSDTDDLTSSSDSGTTLPQPTTAADHISSQSTPTSVPQTQYFPTAPIAELETMGQVEVQPEDDIFPEAQNTDPTATSADVPEVTPTASNPPVASASTGPTQGSSTVLENSQVTSIPASLTLEPTPIPEATTSNPDTEINADRPTTGHPLQELDALTTPVPTPTDAVQDDTADDITPGVTAVDSLNVTPDPTKATSKPQDKPEPYKPPPAKPTLTKPSSKPEVKPLDTAQTANIDNPRDYQAGKKPSNHWDRFSTVENKFTQRCILWASEGKFQCKYLNFLPVGSAYIQFILHELLQK